MHATGSGLMGMNFPGCAETFHSQPESFRPGQREEEEQQRGQGRRGEQSQSDQHQKVQRIRQGDIIAVPAGVSHWCYNNGNQELVAVVVNDLNNQANQLDQSRRVRILINYYIITLSVPFDWNISA